MILFISRNPPNSGGPGGSQRAMHLLRAVARHGPVDFLLLYRDEDSESVTDTLDEVRPLVRSCKRLEISEWTPSWRRWPRLSWRMGQIAEAVTLKLVDAPRFSRNTLAAIASHVPNRDYDLIFAARLSSAQIADDLITRGAVTAKRRVVDFDDRLSAFKQRTYLTQGAGEGRLRRMLQRLEIRRLRRVEGETVSRWDAASVANGLDARAFGDEMGKRVHVVPNVVERPLLPFPEGNALRLLFVGHLSYHPNVHGLTRFLEEIWPKIRDVLPHATLDVVGMRPNPKLAALIQTAGARLHANVPSVEPFYAACDIVVAPIWEGGGTRIKILEAMAYGRPVVSTAVGAEGLDLQNGVTGVIADTAQPFVDAVLVLAQNPIMRRSIVDAARRVQWSISVVGRSIRQSTRWSTVRR